MVKKRGFEPLLKIIIFLLLIQNINASILTWVFNPPNNSSFTPWTITLGVTLQMTPPLPAGEIISLTRLGTTVSLPSPYTFTINLPFTFGGLYTFSASSTNVLATSTIYQANWVEGNITIKTLEWVADEQRVTGNQPACLNRLVFSDSMASQNYYQFYLINGQKARILSNSPPTPTYYVETGSSFWNAYNLASNYDNGPQQPLNCKQLTIDSSKNQLYGVRSVYEPAAFLFFNTQFLVNDFQVTSSAQGLSLSPLVSPTDTFSQSRNYYFALMQYDKSNTFRVFAPNPLLTNYTVNLVLPSASTWPVVGGSIQLTTASSASTPNYPNITPLHYLFLPTTGFPFYMVRLHLTFSSVANIAYLDHKCIPFPQALSIYRDIQSTTLDYRIAVPLAFTNCQQFTVSAVMTNGLSKIVFSQPITIYPVTASNTLPSFSNGNVSPIDSQTSEIGTLISMNYLYSPYLNSSTAQVQVPIYNDSLLSTFAVYPFGMSGIATSMGYRHRFAISPDIPSMSTSLKLFSTAQFPNAINNPNRAPKLDVLNPIVLVSLSLINSTNGILDATVQDSIGIGDRTCSITIGSDIYQLTSAVRTRGDASNGSYRLPFTYNPIYCTTPHQITCRDIRGNVLQIDTLSPQSLNYFIKNDIKSNVCDKSNGNGVISVHRTNYYYQSSNTVAFTIVFSSVGVTLPSGIQSATLSLYRDKNNQVKFVDIPLTLENSDIVAGILSTTYTFSVNNSNIYYFGLTIQLTNQINPFIWFTKDLDYFNGRSNWAQTQLGSITGVTSITLRPPGSIPIPDMTVNLYTPDIVVQFLNSPVPIKNFTVAAKDAFLVPMQLYNFIAPPTTGLTLPAAVTIKGTNFSMIQPSGALFFVSRVCDMTDWCEDYTPFTYFVMSTLAPPPPPSTVNNIVLTSSPSVIDVMSKNRTYTTQLQVTGPVERTSTPVLFIVEKYSEDALVCFFVLNSFNSTATYYNCSIDIPLGWGLRGVIVSVWNIIVGTSPPYAFRGDYLSQSINFTGIVNIPTIYSTVTYYNSSSITIKGVNLGYLLDNQFIPTLVSGNVAMSFNNTFGDTINTMYIQLPNGFIPMKPFEIIIGSIKYMVDVLGCTFPRCSDHGTCNMTTFECDCQPGWLGIGCNIAQTSMCKQGDCINNGVCVTGMCSCKDGYIGNKCQHIINPNMKIQMSIDPLNPTCYFKSMNLINNSNSKNNNSTNLPSIEVQLNNNINNNGDNNSTINLSESSKLTNFTIKLITINEVDVNGMMVHQQSLDNWTLISSNQSTYSFKNVLDDGNATVIVTINVYSNYSNTTFAQDTISMASSTFKYTIRLSNYTFTSKLNTLQFTYQTIVLSPSCTIPIPNNNNNDNGGGGGVTYGGSSDQDMHWIQMDRNQLSLYSRFTNKMVVDDRIIMNANVMASVDSTNSIAQITVSSPYFEQYVEMDPDFSVLTDINRPDSNSCSNDSSRPWLLPVIIVCAVVAGAIIFTILLVLYRKNTYIRTKVFSLKSKRNSIKLLSK